MLRALSDTTVLPRRARADVAAMLAAPASNNTRHWRPERPRMWAVPEPTPQPRRTNFDVDLVGLATRPAEPDPTTSEPLPLSMGMQLPGSRLRILDRISDGGCGVVYRGEHVDLQRQVAIKVMRVEALGAGSRELFLDEARTTTRIESRYVVQVVDFGELPDGRVWYAMEHLGGRSLDQLIATGRIEPARAIALLRMACKGLAASHEAGVVHRDVKPQNLVVIARGGREHLVLVDFGIALPCGTKPTVVSGTPEYMAREQILRDVLDARTDVYGLGCCAYELLTGLPVIDRSSTVQHALLMHTEGVDPPFPAELDIPEALQEIVRRCLAVDREDRFADMHELEAALCEAQIACGLPLLRDDLELPLVDAPRRRRIADGFAALARPRRRLRDRAALLSSSVIAAALALVVIWPGHPASADDEPTSTLPVPTLAAAVALPIVTEVQMAGTPALADADAVAVEPVIEPAPVVAVQPTPTRARESTRVPAPAEREADVSRSAALAAETTAITRPEIPRAKLSHEASRDGRRALRRGDRVAAEAAFRRALHLDARSSSALAGLADVYFERGEHDRAMHFAKLAVQRSPNAAAHRVRLGDSYYRLARYQDARSEYVAAKKLGSASAGRRLAALARSGS